MIQRVAEGTGGCLEHWIPTGRGCPHHEELAAPCGCTPFWWCADHVPSDEGAVSAEKDGAP